MSSIVALVLLVLSSVTWRTRMMSLGCRDAHVITQLYLYRLFLPRNKNYIVLSSTAKAVVPCPCLKHLTCFKRLLWTLSLVLNVFWCFSESFAFCSFSCPSRIFISSDLRRQLMGRGFFLLYRRLFSSGISIMLRHITLPRQESMNLKMKPLRWEIILFSSRLHWPFLPSAVRLLLDSGHRLCVLVVAAAVGTAGMRGWRAWDEWHCMVTFCRASLHGYTPGFVRTLWIVPGINTPLSETPQSQVTCQVQECIKTLLPRHSTLQRYFPVSLLKDCLLPQAIR